MSEKRSSNIHSTAVVASTAEIAENVQIGPYSVIGANVKIGPGTWIGPHVVVEGYTTIGANNRLFQFASIGSAPQDLKYKGEPTLLIIGDSNIIREYVTLQPGTIQVNGETVIGNGNLFMASSHVGHDSIVGNGNVFANNVALAGHVTIHNKVIVGGMAGIHQFCTIGNNAMLSGGSMVVKDVPPYCIAQGDRAKLRGLNTLGLQRAGFEKGQILDIKKAYRNLFMSRGKMSERINSIPAEVASQPHISAMIEFIKSSQRGICSVEKE